MLTTALNLKYFNIYSLKFSTLKLLIDSFGRKFASRKKKIEIKNILKLIVFLATLRIYK